MLKRTMDIVVSLTLLFFLSPIIVLVAIMIRRKMGAPVLFKQQRPGLNEKPFYLYKFRTMNDAKDKNGEALSDSARMTSLGKILRSFSVDEIPQLINVLKGEMSLVGPRPLLMEYVPFYTEEQSVRHSVRPGITGWAQIKGRNAITWEEKFKFDIWYVRHHSLLLDTKILLLTGLTILKREGIHHQGHVSMEKFKGTKEGLQDENHHFG